MNWPCKNQILYIRPNMNKRAKLLFLYTNIGRGHPFYLDGIAEALVRSGKTGLIRQSKDVFELSGTIGRQVWNLARIAYQHGASDNWLGRAYSRLRRGGDYNRNSLLLSLAGRGILKQFESSNADYTLVAHPILVGILKGRPRLIYQHGELVAPDESLVRGAEKVLVPTSDVAERFINSGYKEEEVIVTGLCIEPSLVRQAKDVHELRQNRYENADSLTGALFSSGAEPKGHVEKLIAVAHSLVEAGQRAVVVCREKGRLDNEITSMAKAAGYIYATVTNRSEIPYDLPLLTIVRAVDRRDESRLVAQLFPSFDFVVAPPHERTNWGLGLGLPFFAITPCYGSFAPLNLELLLHRQVAFTVDSVSEATRFASNLERLRKEGELSRRATNGWGQLPINGFATIADWLSQTLEPE